MDYVDAHCHMDLYADAAAVASKASAADIGILAVTNAPFVFDACRKLLASNPNVWVAVGLHPELVGRYGGQVDDLVEYLNQTRFVGEVGLDYRVTKPSTHQLQRDVFEKILMACDRRHDSVVSIHSRGAESDVVSMLDEGFRGTCILHWYSGTVNSLDVAQAKGSYFSVNSSMIASNKGRNLIKRMDRSRILIETDGPFIKIKQRQARPLDVLDTVVGISHLWEEDVEVVRSIVMDNWLTAIGKPA